MPMRPLATVLRCAGLGLLVACASAPQPDGRAAERLASFPPLAETAISGPARFVTFSSSDRHLFIGEAEASAIRVLRVADPAEEGSFELGFEPTLLLTPRDKKTTYVLGRSLDGSESVIARITEKILEEAVDGASANSTPSAWTLGRLHEIYDGAFDPQAKTLYYTDLASSAIYVLDLGQLDETEPGAALDVDRIYLEGGPGTTIYSGQLGRSLVVLHAAAGRDGEAEGADLSLIDAARGTPKAVLSNSDRGISEMALIELMSATARRDLILFLDRDGRQLRTRVVDFRGRTLSGQFRLLGWEEQPDLASGRHGFRIGVFWGDNILLAAIRFGSNRARIYSGRFADADTLLLNLKGEVVTAGPIDRIELSDNGRMLAATSSGLLTIFDVSGRGDAQPVVPQQSPPTEADDPAGSSRLPERKKRGALRPPVE